MAHWLREPKPVVETPIRPYAAAPPVAQSSRASRWIVAAGTPLTRSASSGVNGVDERAAARSTPSTYAGGPGEALGEHRAQHREQHDDVGARPDEEVLGRRSWRSRCGAGRARRSGRRAP